MVGSIRFLTGATKTPDAKLPFGDMLGLTPGSTATPQTKGRRVQFLSHQLNHFTRCQPELAANRIEACAIFPGHLDDAIHISNRKISGDRTLHHKPH